MKPVAHFSEAEQRRLAEGSAWAVAPQPSSSTGLPLPARVPLREGALVPDDGRSCGCVGSRCSHQMSLDPLEATVVTRDTGGADTRLLLTAGAKPSDFVAPSRGRGRHVRQSRGCRAESASSTRPPKHVDRRATSLAPRAPADHATDCEDMEGVDVGPAPALTLSLEDVCTAPWSTVEAIPHRLLTEWAHVFLDEIKSFNAFPSDETLLRVMLVSKGLLAAPRRGGKQRASTTERLLAKRLAQWRTGRIVEMWLDIKSAWERKPRKRAITGDGRDATYRRARA